MILAHKPDLIFDESFNPRVQRAILRSVVVGWNEASRSVRARFDRFAAHDLIGHERRAYVENNLYAMAKRFGLTQPQPQLNHSCNGYHVELISGTCVLTASAVDQPSQVVREAHFRNTLARDPQMKLFGGEPPAAVPGTPLYGLVLYGPPSRNQDGRFPGFVNVAFPTPQCDGYVGNQVSLMDRFRVEYGQLVLLLRRNEGFA